MYVYSYEQLVAIVNQQAATIAKNAAVINNLQSERQWLEEDNDIQREELEKSQKNLKDLETTRNLTENELKKELARLKESQYDIKWRYKNAVRELSGEKKRNLKLKAQCTSLLDKLDQSTQELQQKKQELDRANQELDLGYSVGEWMYQHLRYYYWGYFELLRYFQWSGPSSGGATITELDTNDRPMEGKTVAVLPHNVTQEVLVSPKPPNSERARTVLDGVDRITVAVNMVKKTDFRTSLIAQSVIELVPSTIVCPKTDFVIRLAPSYDQNLIEFLSPLINNTSSCRSIPEVPEAAQLSAIYSEVHTTPGNHLQQLAICAPEWVNAPTTIPTLVAVKGAGRAPRVQKKKERSNATKLTNITSCNKAFESLPLKTKEKHERGNDEPKVGHCQPTTASNSSEPDRLSLANNRQSVDSCDGEKEVSTRKEERRRTGEKKPKTLVSWLKNYRYSAKLNWPKMVSGDQLIKILGV